MTLPCLENMIFKSVARVRVDRPDTHKLRLADDDVLLPVFDDDVPDEEDFLPPSLVLPVFDAASACVCVVCVCVRDAIGVDLDRSLRKIGKHLDQSIWCSVFFFS